jgi:hypothetical protein
MSAVKNVTYESLRSFIKNKAPYIGGFLLISLLLVFTINLSESINLDVDVSNLGNDYILLVIISSLTFLFLLFAIIRTFILDNIDTMGLRDASGKLDLIRIGIFTLIIALFVTALYCLLDVTLQETYLQLGPVVLVRVLVDSLNFDIPGLSGLVGREFYQTARNLIFALAFFGVVLYVILSLVTLVTRTGRKRVRKRFQKREKEIDDELEIDEENNKSFYQSLLFIFIVPINLFLFNIIQPDTSIIQFIVLIFIIITSLYWLNLLRKVLVAVFIGGVKITPFLTSVNFLLLIPVLFVFWILPALFATVANIIVQGTLDQDLFGQIINNFFFIYLFDFETVLIYDMVIFASIAILFIGLAQGASLTAIFKAIKSGVDITRTGSISAEQSPKIVLWTKYFSFLGIWFSLFLESLRPLWDGLKAFIADLPDFPFPEMIEWLSLYVKAPLEGFIDSLNLPLVVPILTGMILLAIPLYFVLSASFKFLSITLYTPQIKNLDSFLALVTTTFVLILVEMLSQIWNMEGITDAPLKFLQDQDVFSTTMTYVQFFEAVFFFVGIFFGIYLLIKKRTWKLKESPEDSDQEPSYV